MLCHEILIVILFITRQKRASEKQNASAVCVTEVLVTVARQKGTSMNAGSILSMMVLLLLPL